MFGVFGVYLNPQSMENNGPQPIITAIKAIMLHTSGVQVGFRCVQVVELRVQGFPGLKSM